MPNEPIYTGIDFEQITDISSSTGLTAAKIPPTEGREKVVYALVQVTGNAMRLRLDGATTAPTNAVGLYIAQYGTIEIWGQTDLNNVRFIEVAGTGVLEVHYFGSP